MAADDMFADLRDPYSDIDKQNFLSSCLSLHHSRLKAAMFAPYKTFSTSFLANGPRSEYTVLLDRF